VARTAHASRRSLLGGAGGSPPRRRVLASGRDGCAGRPRARGPAALDRARGRRALCGRPHAGLAHGGRDRPGRDAADDLLAAVVSDLADWTWYAAERPEAERLALGLALYRDLPSYAVLLYSTGAYRQFGDETRAMFWAAVRALLADANDRLADPIAYALWCDNFEDATTVQEAWRGIDPATLAPRGLARLLDAAGPVPWALKAPLYERLLPDRAWHPALFRSLSFSRFDAYGEIAAPEALALLSRLRLPRDTAGLAELRAALEEASGRASGRRSPRRARA
jgi:hypothetical protein